MHCDEKLSEAHRVRAEARLAGAAIGARRPIQPWLASAACGARGPRKTRTLLGFEPSDCKTIHRGRGGSAKSATPAAPGSCDAARARSAALRAQMSNAAVRPRATLSKTRPIQVKHTAYEPSPCYRLRPCYHHAWYDCHDATIIFNMLLPCHHQATATRAIAMLFAMLLP